MSDLEFRTQLLDRVEKLVKKARLAGLDERAEARAAKLVEAAGSKDWKSAQRQLSKLSAGYPKLFPSWTIDAARRASEIR